MARTNHRPFPLSRDPSRPTRLALPVCVPHLAKLGVMARFSVKQLLLVVTCVAIALGCGTEWWWQEAHRQWCGNHYPGDPPPSAVLRFANSLLCGTAGSLASAIAV